MINFSKPKHSLLAFSIIVTGIIITFLFSLSFEDEPIGTYGVNRTIGWAWDYCEINLLGATALLVCLFGYMALWTIKARVNKVVSILHAASILVGLIVYFKALQQLILSKYSFWISIISILLFLANAIFAFIYKMSSKKGKIDD